MDKNLITKKLIPIKDKFLQGLKDNWFSQPQRHVTMQRFVPMAEEWFRSTKLNDIQGWDEFPCVDVIMGCTHFIESFVLKYGWEGMQILPQEYGYYGMMGKFGNELGSLEPNKPLIISLPNWYYADLRPEWPDLLKECEQKNIDIHIDFAWITTARDIQIDLDHPCIKSFAMSMSKYSLEWNRVGLRWSRQRTMDSVAVLNQYYGEVNSALTSCGIYMINNIPRDYGWNTYGDLHFKACHELDLTPTKMIHVARQPDQTVVGIGSLLSHLGPGQI